MSFVVNSIIINYFSSLRRVCFYLLGHDYTLIYDVLGFERRGFEFLVIYNLKLLRELNRFGVNYFRWCNRFLQNQIIYIVEPK